MIPLAILAVWVSVSVAVALVVGRVIHGRDRGHGRCG